MTPQEAARRFVKKSFTASPHYSFDDWHVMYNHSLMVEKIALKLSRNMKCDKTVISMGALLHDIGKTYNADSETLHRHHEDFNLTVSEKFLEGLGLEKKTLVKMKKIISYKSSSTEMKIIKDADTLAFYADPKLNGLFLKWARSNNLNDAIERKINKYENLNFETSKKLGIRWFIRMKKDWGYNKV